jgi:DNA-binding NtrC family response regulator
MATTMAPLHKRRSPTALPTILVVDAGVTFGLSLHRSLREYGYDVRLATSADQALRSVQARHFDMMVVHDEGLGCGRAAIVAVRGVATTLPCVVIGAEGIAEGEHEIIARTGRVSVLSQPLDLMQLIAKIETALEAGPPADIVCEMATSDQATRRDLPVMSSADRATRDVPKLEATRRVPTSMEDPPENTRSRRPTVRLRALDAGVYSIVHTRREVVDRIGAQ